MRSIGIVLKNVLQKNLTNWLDQFGSKAYYDNQWYYPSEQGEVVLYMWLNQDFANEFEQEDYASFVQALGNKPSAWISVEVSGRFDGTTEVKQFTTSVLKEFEGLAFDEYSDHLWTLSEIENDSKIDNHQFFSFGPE